MKATMKRSLACLVLAMMLLTMLPFAAFAEGETTGNQIVFDFTGVVTEGSMTHEGYEATNIGRNWINAMSSYGPVVSYPEYTEYGPEIKPEFYIWDYRFWCVFTLKDIPAGMYNVTLELADNTGKSCPVEVYLIARSALSKINTSGPMAQMQKNTPATTFNGNETSVNIKNVALADDEKGEYMLMFNFLPAEAGKELESLTDTTIKLKSVTLEKATGPVVKPTQPTIPDFNTPEEPSDNADGGSFPVVPVVLAAVAVVAVAVVVVIVLKKKKSA